MYRKWENLIDTPMDFVRSMLNKLASSKRGMDWTTATAAIVENIYIFYYYFPVD